MLKKRFISLVLLISLFSVCIPVHSSSGRASTLQEFAAMVEEYASRLETSYAIPCEWTLTEELKKPSSVGKGITLLSEIMIRAGSGPYSVAWYDDRVLLSGVTYYAGWIILHRWQNGTADQLSSQEKLTLEKALALVSGASGTDLEKERYIYDELCARITYDTSDDSSGDKDCAIGALLNGRADCDGYSDAMLLCCGLAGIPCRFIHGDSVVPSRSGSGDNSHLWNLVYVGDSWLMCDVTWGDHDHEEPSYLYFNLGRRDASLSYHWNTDTQFSDIASTADFATQLMPDQQPAIVYSQEDVRNAARAATSAGLHHFSLYCPEEVFWQTDYDSFLRMLYCGAVGQHSYASSGRMYEISNITLPDDPFCFCDSEKEILSAIREYADAGINSFSLYFAPALAAQMFANNHVQLLQVLSESCLEEPGRYSYSEENGHITLSNVSFSGSSLSTCASLDDMVALVRRELPSQPSSLSFLFTGGLSFDQISDVLSTAIYSLGADSFSYSCSGKRITIFNLAYCDNYCLAESEKDVRIYIHSVKDSKKNSLRIYCSDALYASLCADNASAFFAILKQAGFTEYSVFHTDSYRMLEAKELR